MSFPTTRDLLTANLTDLTAEQGVHPAHHNALATAVNALEGILVGPTQFNVLAYGATGDGVTNDTAAIQAAIDAAALVGKGEVVFPPTTANKYLAVGLNLTGKPVTLRGSGSRGTALVLYADTDHLLKALNVGQVTGIDIRDLGFYSNVASPTHDGVHLENVALFTITRCSFAQFSGGTAAGVNLALNAALGSITDCIFGSTNYRGLALGSGSSKNRIHGNWFDENTSAGIYCNGEGNAITGNVFQDNTGHHIFLDVVALKNAITSCTAYKGSGGTATGAFATIYGNTNLIAANIVEQMGGANDIAVQIGATGNAIRGNTFLRASGAISDLGTGSIIRQNVGHKTEAQGTATIASGATSVVVTHGLATTPTLANIVITATNNPTNTVKYWISTPTATQFTLNASADPGASTATFVWTASLVGG